MLALGPLLPNRDGTPYGLIVTIPGALMTTAALLMIFRGIRSLETQTAERSNNPKADDAA
ncbi:MAG: hypothetical protein JNM43_05850 [Planctomycetaceae bacterium]|nr:hypothetical protein [Planctomycetaceae bacterium]